MSTVFNVGGSNANVNADKLNFSDGTVQTTAAKTPPVTQTGVAVCTGGGPSITFATPFVATSAPTIVVTQIGSSPNGLGVAVHVNGVNGNWTGFTLELSGSFFGAYAWVAFGNPN